ncbi:MAG: insecticidal toxin complex protein, partial [Sphingobacteriales bacterium]
VFLLAGAEDLVPRMKDNGDEDEFISSDQQYLIKRYVPRIEGLFARIEYIRKKNTTDSWWRVTTKDNITTWYGLDDTARIADPDDNGRIFEWLPQLSTDHKGNVQRYTYLKENKKGVSAQPGVHEHNRLNDNAKFTNTYLKNVAYTPATPWYVPESYPYEPLTSNPLPDFLMKAVFDYGDHTDVSDDEATRDWTLRHDPFSSYHAGFEIRTYRQCKRVMMFHYFEELGDNTLVRSLNLEYKDKDLPAGTLSEADMIVSATQTGYVYDEEGNVHSKSLPAMSFDYKPLQWDNTVHEVSAEDFRHAPQGLTGPYQWMDLEGEGISGILSEQGGGWFYKNNLGNGHFAPARSVSPKPSFSGLGNMLQW